MAVITESPHRIKTNMGDYVDVEVNIVNILKRALKASDGRLAALDVAEFINVNPKLITVKKVPAFFVWCDGSQADSQELGGLRSKALSKKEDFYCTIQMIHSGADEYENAHLVKHAGHVFKEALFQNMNLNDMMNHTGELFEVNFSPEPFEVGGVFKMMQGFEIKMRYTKTTRSKQAQR